MRKLWGYTWKRESICDYLMFNTCTQDKNRQGYRCLLKDQEKCVGHVTFPFLYFDIGTPYDFMGLFAYLNESDVRKCPLRQPVQSLENKI